MVFANSIAQAPSIKLAVINIQFIGDKSSRGKLAIRGNQAVGH